ncbi:MAG: AAA family ATPase, partial [Acutalibacteraceae bacterium]|nr:AAA family ATPase [Acutalibacteraceae bacterium]
MVKITSFAAENVKRIKAVQFEPTKDGLTIIGGGNANGKTSVLDSIVYALGGEKYRPKNLNRDGAKTPAKIRLVLSNGLIVERSGKNAALKVTDPTGQKAGQKLLNEFIEPLALDLPRFLAATDKEKGETLLRIIGVGDELEALDKRESALYNERTYVGRDADRKQKLADALEYYPDAPAELVSAADLIRQQQEILARNGQREQWRRDYDRILDRITTTDNRIETLTRQLKEAQEERAALDKQRATAEKTPKELELESTEAIERSIADIEETNRRVRANLSKANAIDEAGHLQDDYKRLTTEIEGVRDARRALLDKADLPLEGLGIRDGALIYKGQAWTDMSGAEQLIVATSIVRRLNPECGFVLMDKLEQMDIPTLTRFGEWLEKEGLQVIATRVSTGEECSIIIEDGMVVKTEETPAAKAEAWKVTEPESAPAWASG